MGPVAKAAVKTTKVAVTVVRHSDEAADLFTASSKVHDATKATDAALDVTKRARRNGHLAGGKHPETGIPFDKNGYPDFSSVSKKDVKIEFTGSRRKDVKAANEAGGYKKPLMAMFGITIKMEKRCSLSRVIFIRKLVTMVDFLEDNSE